MSKITLKNVTKRYEDTIAASDLTLEVSDGEFVVIFGQPGAGKTTTLQLIAGIEQPTSGSILFDDREVNDLPPQKRDITLAFEAYALYPHKTVRETLAFPLLAPGRGLSEQEREKRILEVAELLEIDPLLDRYPNQLSGGQRQRVSLGRALVRTANVTLLDEPIAHLDARLRHMLRGELRHFQEARGATTIYATPDYNEAVGIADRIAVLVAGELRQFASPETLYAKPSDLDVATMVGDPKMNVFPLAKDESTIVLNGTSVAVPDIPPEARYVGIRPVDIEILRASSESAIPGEVYVSEPVGYDQVVRVQVNEHMVNAKLPLTAGDFSAGENVWLLPDWESGHLFDADGLRWKRER